MIDESAAALSLVFRTLHFRWFHGKISRQEAESMLQPRKDGLFLVRESVNFPGDFTVCVCFEGDVEHYRIIYQNNSLTIDEEDYFENLTQLVEVSKVTLPVIDTIHCFFYVRNLW